MPNCFAGLIVTNDRASALNSVDLSSGGGDTITTGVGSDIVVGGVGNDIITAGDGQNIVFGDDGAILSAVTVNGTADLAQPLDGRPITLGQIGTMAPQLGGNDTITTGVGRDIILGGPGADLFRRDGNTTRRGVDK